MHDDYPGGCTGKILRVNLSENRISTESVEKGIHRKFLGGSGLVAHYLLKELSPGVDPLGPENKLVFALGPVTGMALPGSGRHCMGARSPMSGSIAKSEVGDFWGAELKKAGVDVIIIEGKAAKPVYLWINDGEVTLRDAGHLWGQATKETQEAIWRELDDKLIRVAMIGPGGENLVRFACVMCGLYDAAGRGGLGAVMGSKNLKAVAVRGRQKVTPADPEGLKKVRQWLADNSQLTKGLATYGTNPIIPLFEKIGNLPIHNFGVGTFPNVQNISAQTIKETIGVGMEGCFACPIRCKKIVEVKEPFVVDPAYGGPEYETIGSFGSTCGVDDIRYVSKANELCNVYSIDTISTGVTIAFAMECYENGLITRQDTGGLDLKFGNGEAMIEMVEMIAHKKGLGAILAEGSLRAAREIGPGAEKFAMQVKGVEIPMHEPRLNKSLGLGYMVHPFGADHVASFIDVFFAGFGEQENVLIPDTVPLGMGPVAFEDIGPRKIGLARVFQFKRTLQDAMVLCGLLPYPFGRMVEAIAAVTGWETTAAEQLRVAERITTAIRCFSTREGFSSKDDELPERFYQPTIGGALSEKPLDREKMNQAKSYFYSLMGWDQTGVPTPEKIDEMEIEMR